MLGCFCLVMCKGDWAEFCSTFGFANWQTKISPCLNCWATLANHLEDEEFGVDCVVWPDFTGDDYLEACVQSEVIVVVMDTDVLKRITQSLFYDKRKKGSFGRALRVDVATDPPLLAGYRLEPSPELLDVGSLDNLTEDDLPTKLTFWNFSQGRIKHRNPLMNPAFGMTPYRLIVDSLHAIKLRVLQLFSRELAWMMFWSGVFCDVRNKTEPEWLSDSVVVLRAELSQWEHKYQAAAKRKITQIQKLTAGHFGTLGFRTLKIKAAETKYFFYFLHSKLTSTLVVDKLPQKLYWKGAADSMEKLLRILEISPWHMSTVNIQELTCVAHNGIIVAAICICSASVPPGPRHPNKRMPTKGIHTLRCMRANNHSHTRTNHPRVNMQQQIIFGV